MKDELIEWIEREMNYIIRNKLNSINNRIDWSSIMKWKLVFGGQSVQSVKLSLDSFGLKLAEKTVESNCRVWPITISSHNSKKQQLIRREKHRFIWSMVRDKVFWSRSSLVFGLIRNQHASSSSILFIVFGITGKKPFIWR